LRVLAWGCDKLDTVLALKVLAPDGKHQATGLILSVANVWKYRHPAENGCRKNGLCATQADLIGRRFPLNIKGRFRNIDCRPPTWAGKISGMGNGVGADKLKRGET
jgi:hypothetical protein